MARKVKIAIREAASRYVVLGERAWLDAEGKPVPDGDPGAASLIGPTGREFLWKDAVALGIVEPDQPDAKSLEDLPTVRDFRAIARARGIDVPNGINRESLLKVIQRAVTMPAGRSNDLTRGKRRRPDDTKRNQRKSSARTE